MSDKLWMSHEDYMKEKEWIDGIESKILSNIYSGNPPIGNGQRIRINFDAIPTPSWEKMEELYNQTGYMIQTETPTAETKRQAIIVAIARIAHEANRAYCETIGDYSQIEWLGAPDWQRNSATLGVQYHLDNPDARPEGSHNSWLQQKLGDGWTYGPVKDAEKKEHPCIVPYAKLPFEQQMKDYIFGGVVKAMITKYQEAGLL